LCRIVDRFEKGLRRGDSVHPLQEGKLGMPAERIGEQFRFIALMKYIKPGMLITRFLG